MNKAGQIAASVILTLCLVFMVPMSGVQAAPRLQDTGEKLVIVIDPGHGGTNLGTTGNGHEEKSMTMITAQAMYDELLLYDDVEVYLTRTKDKTLDLASRAKFAASVNADFLFSIHYNASETHENYGSEVWVSSFKPYNAYGYQFGCIFLQDMREKGLFVRGVKTRMGEKDKDKDYYGIIRESVELGIPALILEHCHVDEAHDEGYCSDDSKLEAFGRADATAVAKYFGLKSSVRNVDYSDYELTEAQEDICVPVTVQDKTEPDKCELEFISADYGKGLLTLSVSASDQDSPLLYYSYSLDGGKSFSSREIWPGCDALTGSYSDTFTLNLEIPLGTKPKVVLRAYNMYDMYRESEPYNSTRTFLYSAGEPSAAPDTKNSAAEPSAAPDIKNNAVEPSSAPDTENSSGEPSAQNTEKTVTVSARVETETLLQEETPPELSDLFWIIPVVLVLFCVMILAAWAVVRRGGRKRGHRDNSESL